MPSPPRPRPLLLIRPCHFCVNEQALPTNRFMSVSQQKESLQAKALEEHRGLVETLERNHFDVMVYENCLVECPDAVFCNNWFSVHHPEESGKTDSFGIMYPMALPNRRMELREDILYDIQEYYGDSFMFYDLRDSYEWAFLEGTGSVVYDRYSQTMYVSLSPRSYYWKLMELQKALDYNLVVFQTNYKQSPVYHTNVLLAIGKEWAVLCTSVIVSESEQKKVVSSLQKNGKKVLEISEYQMGCFCGNILEITNREGKVYTVMSQKAHDAFTGEQREALGNLLVVPLDTIERYGGGGVRCCIAEV